ncbi:hypothetical protein HDU98_001203, partial [Podochytrium sp. JEL0797]
MQAAHFPVGAEKNTDVSGQFMDSSGTAETLVPLKHLNVKAMGLLHGKQTTRVVTVLLMFDIKVSSGKHIVLHLVKPPPIVFPSEKRNKFLNLTPCELAITLSEDEDFVVRMPLKTVHMTGPMYKATQECIGNRQLPKKAQFVRAEKSDSETCYDSVVGTLNDMFERRKGLWEQLHVAYAGRNHDLQNAAKANLAPISIALTRLIGTIKKDLDPKYRRRIDDVIKKLSRESKYGSFRFDLEKLSLDDPALRGFFLEKQGHFQSPHIWFQMPDVLPPDQLASPFKSWFGLLRLLGFSDPGTRTVETQKLSTGHRVQIAPGFEHTIRYWQDKINRLQGKRDKFVNNLQVVKTQQTAVDAAWKLHLDACDAAGLRVEVDKIHLQAAVIRAHSAAT